MRKNRKIVSFASPNAHLELNRSMCPSCWPQTITSNRQSVDFLAPFPVFIFFIVEVRCHLRLPTFSCGKRKRVCMSPSTYQCSRRRPTKVIKGITACISYEQLCLYKPYQWSCLFLITKFLSA